MDDGRPMRELEIAHHLRQQPHASSLVRQLPEQRRQHTLLETVPVARGGVKQHSARRQVSLGRRQSHHANTNSSPLIRLTPRLALRCRRPPRRSPTAATSRRARARRRTPTGMRCPHRNSVASGAQPLPMSSDPRDPRPACEAPRGVGDGAADRAGEACPKRRFLFSRHSCHGSCRRPSPIRSNIHIVVYRSVVVRLEKFDVRTFAGWSGETSCDCRSRLPRARSTCARDTGSRRRSLPFDVCCTGVCGVS